MTIKMEHRICPFCDKGVYYAQSYRSVGRGVNGDYDMCRVTIDLPMVQARKLIEALNRGVGQDE